MRYPPRIAQCLPGAVRGQGGTPIPAGENGSGPARSLQGAAIPTGWLILLLGLLCSCLGAAPQETPRPRVLAFYSTDGEGDHTDFALQAVPFFRQAAERGHFTFEATTRWEDLNPTNLRDCRLILWLNDIPRSVAQREAFRAYMERGGSWLGFHFAGYTDSGTQWPWYVGFLGGGEYSGNNWPPLPAVLSVDDPANPVTAHLPSRFLSPANEWYTWTPNPRLNPHVKVLLTLDPSNLPLGFKETIQSGDVLVVWTNTGYRMIYMNMGHGDRIFDDPAQDRMFEDAVLWLLAPR